MNTQEMNHESLYEMKKKSNKLKFFLLYMRKSSSKKKKDFLNDKKKVSINSLKNEQNSLFCWIRVKKL